MKIDWKYVCKTPGYISLKATYIHDVREAAEDIRKHGHAMRDKAVFLELFNWVINRAKHHAIYEGVTIDVILDRWEEERAKGHHGNWWLNFYKRASQSKRHSNSKKPMGLKGIKKYYKNCWHSSPELTKKRVCEFIQQEQKNRSTRTKARWPDWRRK